MNTPRIVPCPQCGAQVVWSGENSYRPFCSERCKLIDLGQWATGGYRIPVVEKDNGSDDENIEN